MLVGKILTSVVQYGCGLFPVALATRCLDVCLRGFLVLPWSAPSESPGAAASELLRLLQSKEWPVVVTPRSLSAVALVT